MATSKQSGAEQKQTFEDAFRALQDVVEQMEQEEIPLEDLLQAYEKGSELLKTCSSHLENAQRRIEVIARNSSGAMTIEPFSETPAPASGPARSRKAATTAAAPTEAAENSLF